MDVTLPNGEVITGVPEGTSKDEVARKAIRAGLATPQDFGLNPQTWEIPGESATGPKQRPVAPEQQVKPRSWVDDAIQGAMAVPVMAGAARGVQLLTQGSKAAPYAANLARAVIPQTGRGLAFEGALGATAGVASGLASEQVEEGPMRTAVGTLAGIAATAPFAMGKNAFDLWVSRGLGGDFAQMGGQASTELGRVQAAAQANTALKANPQLGPTVLRAAEIEKQTGITLPMLAQANGDTTISGFLQSQTTRGNNAEFTAALKQQYLAAEQALKTAQKGKAPSMAEVDAYVKRKAAETQAKNSSIVAKAQANAANREKGLANIDAAITSLTGKLDAPGRLETGKRLTNLIEAKEAAIRSELSPQYKELLEGAAQMGVVLPGEAAKQLKNFTSDQLNKDVFQKFPKLYGMIQKEFSTPPVSTSTKAAGKYTFAKEAAVTKDVPLSTLDSLKREVNSAIRDTDNKDDLRRLYLLKDEVDKAIDALDPAFTQAYRALDKEYATRLGIPFKEQGVVNINRAKFVEDTVPKMTQNASSLKQTLAVVGDDPNGIQLVKDAFLYDISQNKSIVNVNGQINPAQLKRYIAQNKDKIDQVPGLRADIESIQNRANVLLDNRTRILEAQRNDKVATVENLWTQAYGTKEGLSGLVRQSLSNPQKLDELLALTTKDKVAQEGVKSALLSDVLQAPGNRVELFTANRSAFEKLFGRDETNNIELIIEASQRLKDNPFKFNINADTITKTTYEEVFGSKPSTSLGEFRNQVLSAPRVFINHVSRFFQGQSSKAEAEEMQKFLLDPKNLEATAKMMAEFETKGFTDKSLNIIKKMALNSSSNYLFGGLTGAGISTQQAPYEGFSPQDASLLEGFGQ
jgi:cell pole-organizing protein PopZ